MAFDAKRAFEILLDPLAGLRGGFEGLLDPGLGVVVVRIGRSFEAWTSISYSGSRFRSRGIFREIVELGIAVAGV